jgi:ABC-type uncharacterized transport system substrate-binding protein
MTVARCYRKNSQEGRTIPMEHLTGAVELGGLLSYGNDLFDSFRRAATYADRILKGATPNELPVQARSSSSS